MNLSRQLGEVWERYIRVECDELDRRGDAFVSKNHEAPPVPGKKTKRAKSKPDFSGVIRGGRHVVFDAKSTLEYNRLDLKNIAKHQLEHLRRCDELGGIAFVYVLSGERRKFVVSVSVIDAAKGASVRLDCDQVFEKMPGETWFDVVERWQNAR